MGMADPYHPGEYTPPDMRIELRARGAKPITPLPPPRPLSLGIVHRVLVLVGMVAMLWSAIMLPLYYFYSQSMYSARWDLAQENMQVIHTELLNYRKQHGHYPKSLNALERKEHFPNGVPKDPFTKSDFMYEPTDTGFRLICLGKDQAEGGSSKPNADIVFNVAGLVSKP